MTATATATGRGSSSSPSAPSYMETLYAPLAKSRIIGAKSQQQAEAAMAAAAARAAGRLPVSSHAGGSSGNTGGGSGVGGLSERDEAEDLEAFCLGLLRRLPPHVLCSFRGPTSDAVLRALLPCTGLEALRVSAVAGP